MSWVSPRVGATVQTRLEQLLLALSLETDDCLLWPYSRTTAGYPSVWHPDEKRTVYGHVEILRRTRGERPPSHEAAHGCGNRACVNKRHLRWALPVDNTADKYGHGTMWHPNQSQKHEINPGAKLTHAQVMEIKNSTVASETLGPWYGVSGRQIRRIRRGEVWK